METFLLSVSTGQLFLISALTVFLYASTCALIAIARKRADFADIAWGPGFCLVAWISFLSRPFSFYTFTINLLITVWALRLACHIFLRNRKRKEDFRYQKMKQGWQGSIAFQMFFRVFLLQGLILYLTSLPIIWINTHSQDISLHLFWTALTLWLLGFFLESFSDYQLFKFQKNPFNHGKLLKTGLWSFVRHPNYLGEILQWWAIWVWTLSMPLGWIFIFSPLLITFLIVKVSGIKPLEEKMKNYPDFSEYAKNTPSLIPLGFLNGGLYTLAWFIIVSYGAKGSFFTALFSSIVTYTAQLFFFAKRLPQSFLVSIPLSLYALFFGMIQETFFIHFKLVVYPQKGLFPPFWLMSLYPLFALTLNSSLKFLNKNLLIAFCLGGVGSLMSYLSAAQLGAVHLEAPHAYPWIFFCWGFYLSLLVLLNRKLISIRDVYTDPKQLKQPITVFFDIKCPICSKEMINLKKREQTGSIIYACPQSDEELKKMTKAFSYHQAMQKIHAIDASGNVSTGIDVLAALYARTNLSILTIGLQAPGFRTLFKLMYAIWAKLRPKNS